MLSVCLVAVFSTTVAGYGMCPRHVECIPGCLKLDLRGCKMCACGPAMFHPGAGYYGMPHPAGGASFHPGTLGGGSAFGSNMGKPAEKPLKECAGTMLCMMTCKGKYSLDKDVGHDGCRACTCPREQTVVKVVEKPPPKTQIVYVQKPATHSDCTGTKLCMLTCKGKYILGDHGRDGCQSCACIPERRVELQLVEHKECHATVLCMTSCEHGHTMGATTNGCKECQCKPASHRLECPQTLKCMLGCKQGYQLGAKGRDGCPSCQCLSAPSKVVLVAVVKCSTALSCNRGCTVGFKCDKNGCPVCECIEPKVVGVLTVTAVYTEKALTCTAALTCERSCSVGYRCGSDGCPTCGCLQVVHTVTNVRPVVVVQPTKPPPTSGVSAVISRCPATLNCMSSCADGYTLGSTGSSGCPKCTCVQKHITECHTCDKKPAMTVHTCDVALRCMTSCTDGYELGSAGTDGCPACRCKQVSCTTGCEETHHRVVLVESVHTSGGSSGSSGGSTALSAGGSGGHMSGGGGGQCKPLPPNCHPWCIKYDVAHCRKCECRSSAHGFGG